MIATLFWRLVVKVAVRVASFRTRASEMASVRGSRRHECCSLHWWCCYRVIEMLLVMMTMMMVTMTMMTRY